jgi:hypothetical protein
MFAVQMVENYGFGTLGLGRDGSYVDVSVVGWAVRRGGADGHFVRFEKRNGLPEIFRSGRGAG